MSNHLRSSRAWLAAMCVSFGAAVAPAADEAIVDNAKEAVKDAAPPPPPADPAKPQAAAEEVELVVPGLKPAEDRNQLNAPLGRVKAVAKRPTGKIPLVSKVTDDIGKEARKGWAADRHWPHDQADYSSREDVGLQNRQLIQSLMKRQDNHPAVDGYVRWQLLSYAPDLSEAKPQEIRAIINNLPELSRLPVPPQPRNVLRGDDAGGGYFFSGVQRAFLSDLTPSAGARGYNPTLSVVNSGSGLDFETPEEKIEKSRSAAYDHVQSRPIIERLNTPTVQYRTALMAMIPGEGGLKLEALFADMRDRIEAGDPSYREACQAFFDEAHRTRDDTTIPEKLRATLANQMKTLGGKVTYVVKEVEINKAGDMKVVRDAVGFPKRHLETLLGYLKGPPKTE